MPRRLVKGGRNHRKKYAKAMKGVQPSTLWEHSGGRVPAAPGWGTQRRGLEQPHPSWHKPSAPEKALGWGW